MNDVEQLQIELRPRGAWEAADLGCLLVRRWPAALYGGWLITALPVFVLVALTLPAHPGIAGLILWWLKPVYERLPMWLLSQRIIAIKPTLRDVGLHWRSLVADLPAALTYRRLSPTRSFDAPLAVLEDLPGNRRRARISSLHRGVGSQAIWLTIICAHVESFLLIVAAIGLILLVIPDRLELGALVLWLTTGAENSDWISNLLYLGVIGLVGPVYAAAGFTLYLNRRIDMEGWDIELGFRRLTARLGGKL